MPKFSGAPSGAPKGSKTIDLGFDSLLFWGRMGEGSDSNFYKNTPLYKNTPPIPPPILIRGGILIEVIRPPSLSKPAAGGKFLGIFQG